MSKRLRSTHTRPVLFVAMGVAAVLAPLSSATGSRARDATPTEVVRTVAGPVRGVVQDGVERFLGIPFAAPPVGELRWKPPQAPRGWSGVRDASAFAPSCVQSNTLGGFAAPSLSEDCLYLNVFRPRRGLDGAPLPVMVWIPGGGLYSGGGAEVYDPRWLVARGVIVVTLQYRLNIFGYFSHAAIDAPGEPSGNYGFMDQQAALRWVQANIARFHGDPGKVTLFGESAGGGSVMVALASPPAAGLFQRAIIESGAAYVRNRLDNVPQSRRYGAGFVQAVGCSGRPDGDTADCLRSRTSAQIVERARRYTDEARPVVDGDILPQSLSAAFHAGAFARVPVINGVTQHELRWSYARYEAEGRAPLRAADYEGTVATVFGTEAAPRVLEQYPLSAFGSASEAISAASSDQRMVCTLRTLDRALAAHVPVYSFVFADERAPNSGPAASFPLGAYHTSELQYLFKDFHGSTGQVRTLNSGQRPLSKAMVAYWTQFAKTGDPNSAATPRWWLTKVGSHNPIRLKPMIALSDPAFAARHRCAFWDSLETRRDIAAIPRP